MPFFSEGALKTLHCEWICSPLRHHSATRPSERIKSEWCRAFRTNLESPQETISENRSSLISEMMFSKRSANQIGHRR